MSDTEAAYDWLRELGAVRPMAAAGDYPLALGKWCNGFYPILYNPERKHPREYFPAKWYVYGIETANPLTREDCERILKSIQKDTKP